MPLQIDSSFPGGNIILEGIDGDTVRVRQDLRDTDGDWFYWNFRVRGAAGRTLRFQFTGSDVFTSRGPSVSFDNGWTWRWLGRDGVEQNGFSFYFATDAAVHFALALPYTQRNWDAFLNGLGSRENLRSGILTNSRGGRPVEKIHAGRLDGHAAHKISITARAHCCETSPSFVLEGLITALFSDSTLGAWYREHAEVLIVPFLDKDGCEAGDQGKNRKPHDHNRDWLDAPIYPEVTALRAYVPTWADDRWSTHFDLHGPWIRGKWNEHIYIVGSADPQNWQRQQQMATELERACRGPLPYHASKSLPWGAEWNTTQPPSKNGTDWAIRSGAKTGITFEIPYALCDGVTVSPENLRSFGYDLAAGLQSYLLS